MDRSEALLEHFDDGFGELHALTFIDPWRAIAVGTNIVAASAGGTRALPVVLQTADAAVSWTSASLPFAPEGDHHEAALFGVAAVDDRAVSVGQDDLSSLVHRDRTTPLGFATTDGGRTWVRGTFPAEVGLLSDVLVLP